MRRVGFGDSSEDDDESASSSSSPLRDFREFSKRMRLDAGLAIETIAGGDVVELDELLDVDADADDDERESDSSDGFSEAEFTVDPEAGLRPDQGDESVIDPETGDFVEPRKAAPPDGDAPETSGETAEAKQDDGEKKEADDDKPKSSGAAMNVRRNIREVMDENQLDASTLAAQRLESERLARVQEQQRIIREVRRQIALERQDKTQARFIQMLQGRAGSTSSSKRPGSFDPSVSIEPKLNIPGTVLMKLPTGDMKKPPKLPHPDLAKIQRTKCNLTPSVSIAPVGTVKQEFPMTDTYIKKDVVEIVDSSSSSSSSESAPSSDSDDCIMLSDSELPPSPEPDEDPQNSGLHVNDAYNIPDEQGRVLINIGHPENEEDIFLAPQISRVIKPHQIGGVRFLFDNIIESVERFSTSTGFGCILAHSMGLGKTLQIVCFCDIFLRHTNSKTVLCIMPINTLQNWVAEFNMWLPQDSVASSLNAHGEVRPRTFSIYVLNDSHKTLQARGKIIKEWNENGGVLMIGYELYRLLSLKKNKKPRSRKKKNETINKIIEAKENDKMKSDMKSENIDGVNQHINASNEMNNINGKDNDLKDILDKKEDEDDTEEEKKLFDEIYEALVKPGPDLVICDEGHRIKNSHSNISYALKQMRTKRRVVLTGYPLQNNLLEYWCMVDFVRPNYLGTKTEFSNMFERPIQNGQCIDSTPQDIRLMRYRAHVLHSLLLGFVQRRSHSVLQSTLPQKEEYVLLVKMTDLQRKLYDTFMNEVVRIKTVPNPLKAFAVCCKIWNHPDVLYYFLKKRNESAAIIDYDLEIEDPTNMNPVNPKGPKNKCGRSKASTPRKKDKPALSARSKKNNKPAASIPPNTSNAVPPTTNYDVQPDSQNTNSTQYSTPPLKDLPSSNTQINTYPYNYQQFNTNSNNYYNTNEPYNQTHNYGTNYYSQQPYNNQFNNNFNSQNTQASPENTSTSQQQNLTRYPNADYNSQNYWGNDSNFYNSSTGYYNQNQSNYPTNQNAYNNVFDPYNHSNNTYQYSQNRAYENQPPNDEQNQANFNTTLPPTTNVNYSSPPIENFNSSQISNVSGNATNNNTYDSSMYNNFQGGPSSTLQETKPPINDDISTLCWPVPANDSLKQETMDSSSIIQHPAISDIKSETKADSDGEIKIADLDTMKVVNDKSRFKEEETDIKLKKEEVVKETSLPSTITPEMQKEHSPQKYEKELSNEMDVSNSKVEMKPKDKKPRERKSKMKRDSKGKDENSGSDSEKEDKKEEIEKKSDKYEEVPYDWATDLLKNYVPGIIENSAKMEIFFCILEESIRLGDRLLLFSQSLFTLNLIEDYLQKQKILGTDQNWSKNKSYYRLDGSTSALEREKLINEFNSNPNIHLFLVSTRAGSLGINLVGANRVVVFDASWNPCHDTQAVCRVYRYGQKKPCFVYRLVMDCCLERKIYDRQINKQGMSDRVVDECNPDAVLSLKEVTNLCWDNEVETPSKEFDVNCKDKYFDIIMKIIVQDHLKTLNKEPFQHESLLVDRKEKKLSSAEKRLAKRGYELEKKAASNPKPSMMYRTIRTADGTLIQRPVASVRPMQHGSIGNTRWIPADVWQRQGMTAQEMTLPLDVVIPTNSTEKSNIVLKAGQKVMVLKSPKGIYMQLESGKIIAIKTSFKVGQNKPVEPKEQHKKILPVRSPVDLPGSLKNNSAITVISKSSRGGMQKPMTRPAIIQKKAPVVAAGTPIRPMITGPRYPIPNNPHSQIRVMNPNLQMRPLSMIRSRPPPMRNTRPIPIQNNLSIKIQNSNNVRQPNPVNIVPIMDKDQSDIDLSSNKDIEYENNEFYEENLENPNIEEKINENQSLESELKPADIFSEDSSQEKSYVDLSVKNESKIAVKSNDKKILPPPKSTVDNLFRDCNIQIKNKTVIPNKPEELGYVNNVTIKRTPAMSSTNNLSASSLSIAKERSLHANPVHVTDNAYLSDGIKISTSQDTILPEDNFDDDITHKERKIYKPNLVERNVKVNPLKSYRHQKMGHKQIPIQTGDYALDKLSPASTSSTPTPPPASIFALNNLQSVPKVSPLKYESSLSQLEKTTSAIARTPKKGGMSDFQQTLSDITRTYPTNAENVHNELAYKPGPKSRKKKVSSLEESETSQTNPSDKFKLSSPTDEDCSNSQSASAPNNQPSSNQSNFPQSQLNPESSPTSMVYNDSSFQHQVPPDSSIFSQQSFNSYASYPPAGAAYPPYPPAPYYQPYPHAPYGPYPQYPAPPPYAPTTYPGPYPGYPPYTNPNPHQW